MLLFRRFLYACLLLAALGFCASCSSSDNATTDGDSDTMDSDDTATTDGDEIEDGDTESSDGDSESEEPDPLSPSLSDDADFDELLETSTFWKNMEWMITERSSWYEKTEHEQSGEEPSDSSNLGYYAVGNGRAFAFVGSWYPRNTVHGIIGPTFQIHGDGFFSDVSVIPYQNGKSLKWTTEWIWKPLEGQIPATRMKVKGIPLEVDTITFAPRLDTNHDAEATIVEVINIRNTGAEDLEALSLRAQTHSDTDSNGDGFIEQLRDGNKMRLAATNPGWQVLPEEEWLHESLALDIEPLAAGEERQFVLVYEFGKDADTLGKGLDAVTNEGWESLLQQTADWWRTWHNKGLHVRTPDRRLNDLIEGLKGAVKVQTAINGALCPMSHYTGIWIRDSYGPTRMWLKFGYPEEAWQISDYYFRAASVRGSIGNALDADIEMPPGPVPEVDWYANMPFGGRLRGEGPSHIPLMHAWYWQYTNKGDDIAARWQYLMHTLKGQEVTPDGLMYFSGDETFRPQLAANIGWNVNFVWEENAYSAFSGFLYVRACEMLAEFGSEYGLESDDIAWLEEEADRVRQLTEERYWLPEEKRYSPFIMMDTLEPDLHCAEDVNTQPIWLGYLDALTPNAADNIQGCMDLILKDNGILQNATNDGSELLGYNIGSGIMSGMSPAFFLYNMASLHHSMAGETLDAVISYASPSGNYPEVGIFDSPGQALCPIYNRSSITGEVWARHRQWEGSVSAEAMMHYLIGYEAELPKKRLFLRPHFLDDSRYPEKIAAENVMYNGQALSMLFETDTDKEALVLTVKSDSDFSEAGLETIIIELGTEAMPTGVEIDGTPLGPGNYSFTELPFGGWHIQTSKKVTGKQVVFAILCGPGMCKE